MIEGWEVSEEQTEAFLECQMREMNKCQFRSCFDLLASHDSHEFLASSIFCNNNSDEFQVKTTSKEPVSASTFMSIHSTLQDVFVSTTSAIYSNTDQSPSTNSTQRMSSNFVPLCK